MIFTDKQFWKAATERAVKTLAQAALSVLVVNGVAVGFNEIDWPSSGWLVLVATIASYLFSIVSAASTDGSPSLANEHLDPVEPVEHDPLDAVEK